MSVTSIRVLIGYLHSGWIRCRPFMIDFFVQIIMSYRYLSREHIAGFDKYKYNALDTSPVSKYISHPLWEFVVQFYPRWIAPNLLTLSGFLLLVFNYLSLSYYDYSYNASDDTVPDAPPVPRWMWLTGSIFVFLAHTLDGTDGKQARRTGTCGPLGELFDHGLDSWGVSLLVACFMSICGRGEFGLTTGRMLCIHMAMITTFYLTHWEKYMTNVMYLPWGYDIAQYTISLMYLVAYMFDYTSVKFRIPLVGWTLCEFYEIYLYVTVFCFSFPVTLWNIYVSYHDGSSRPGGVGEVLRPLAPLSLLVTLSLLWAHMSSIDLLEDQLRPLMFLISVLFSNLAIQIKFCGLDQSYALDSCRLMVSCMSSTQCDTFNWLLAPLLAIVAAVSVVSLGRLEVYLLWTYAALALGAHVHYGVCVVRQLAEHLGIRVFLVGKRAVKHSTSNSHKIHHNSH